MQDYTLTVSNTSGDINWGNISSSHYCGTWCNHYTDKFTYYWPSPTYIYMYEFKCKGCRTRNFGQLEEVTACKKCNRTTKLTSKSSDFEEEIKP